MKKAISLILSLCLVLSAFTAVPLTVFAEEEPDLSKCIMFDASTTGVEDISDVIVPIDFEGKKIYVETLELIRADKSTYQREKDKADIEFIDKHGIDREKYQRVKKGLEESKQTLSSYESSIVK